MPFVYTNVNPGHEDMTKFASFQWFEQVLTFRSSFNFQSEYNTMLHKCTNTPYGQPFVTVDERSNETLRFPFYGSPNTAEIIITFDGGEVAQISELEIEYGPQGQDDR